MQIRLDYNPPIRAALCQNGAKYAVFDRKGSRVQVCIVRLRASVLRACRIDEISEF